MSNKSNFNSTVTPNTKEEQIKILEALLKKQKVYFYYWNSYLTRMQFREFKMSSELPNFDMYRYDTSGELLDYRSAVRFSEGGLKTIDRASVLYPGTKGAHVNVWFDKEGVLCIERADGSNVRFLLSGTGVDVESRGIPVPVPTPAEVISNDQRDKVHVLWKLIRETLSAEGVKFRTAKYEKRKRWMYFSLSDLQQSDTRRAIIRLSDCVLVSQESIPVFKLQNFTISKKDTGKISNCEELVELKGYVFKRFALDQQRVLKNMNSDSLSKFL